MKIRQAILVALAGTILSGPAYAAGEFFKLRADLRRCASPMCGGFFYEPVNVPNICSTSNTCYVAGLDLSDTGLKQLPGPLETILVQGELTEGPQWGDRVFKNLQVQGVWQADRGQVGSSEIFSVQRSDIVCFTTPCPSLRANLLNTDRSWLVSRLVFKRQLPAANLRQDMVRPVRGGIIGGQLQDRSRQGRLLFVNQVFQPVPGPCLQQPCPVPLPRPLPGPRPRLLRNVPELR